MIALDRPVVLDTWVLVHLCRDKALGRAIMRQYQLRERPITPIISAVTVGEMYAFARRADWGGRRRALLTAFGSVQGVKDAGLDAIALVPGFSKALATRVLVGLGIAVPTDEQATVSAMSTDLEPPSQPIPE